MESFLKNLGALLQKLFSALSKQRMPKSSQPVPVTTAPEQPPSIDVILENVTPSPVIDPEPQNNGFLACPIQGSDKEGKPLTSRTVKVVSVIDHSDTAIDPASSKRWGLRAKDQKVTAFNGEIGDGEACASPPLGYTKKIPEPFFANGEINYVGVHSTGDKYPANYYLNYDGHAGYDFGYPRMTPILATSDGLLHKASNTEDSVYGQGWEAQHTFYIKHQNGYSTWYRHCVKLSNEVEAKIGSDYSKSCAVRQGQVVAYVGDVGAPGSVHLHFEVKDTQGKIVDPYGDNLWMS